MTIQRHGNLFQPGSSWQNLIFAHDEGGGVRYAESAAYLVRETL